jgi:hypothetical protein
LEDLKLRFLSDVSLLPIAWSSAMFPSLRHVEIEFQRQSPSLLKTLEELCAAIPSLFEVEVRRVVIGSGGVVVKWFRDDEVSLSPMFDFPDNLLDDFKQVCQCRTSTDHKEEKKRVVK